MKSVLLTFGSFALSATVITNAYYHKKQFYPSVVYITKSSPSMAVLYLQAFVAVILMGKVMRKIFFGQLRAAEMEHLIERSWYAVTETCLAFTVFRDDFSPRFVALFTVLLFLKCFHWLAEDRIDYMERSPLISLLFQIRAISLLSMLGFLDLLFVNHAYHNTLIKGPSVQLVFGFEYAILFAAVIHVFFKYVLHAIDLHSENPWENKAVYLLHTELVLGFFKVMLYVVFLAIMIKIHTFPLFVVRPMYLTVREFKKAFNDAIMSRRAIRNMNTLYPDATAEELSSGDNICIICREEMHVSCKKLPCNHIFHSNCLRSWFQRQQTCPTCRLDVFRVQQQQQRPQAQQQAQQLAQAPAPLAGFQIAPGVFPIWPQNPFPAPPQQQPIQQDGSAVQSPLASMAAAAAMMPTSAAPTYAGAFGGPMNSMPPPFMMMPPFNMPFGGYLPQPPPPVPTNLSGLSDEQLRKMEGDERSNVEARVQWLQDIQTLLNAAMIQIQQYGSVTSRGIQQQQQHRSSFITHPITSHGWSHSSSSSFSFPPRSNADNTKTTSSAISPQSSSRTQTENLKAFDLGSQGNTMQVTSTDDSSSFSKLQSSEAEAPSNPSEPELEGAVGYSSTAASEEVIPDWTINDEIEVESNELYKIRRRRLQLLTSSDEQNETTTTQKMFETND